MTRNVSLPSHATNTSITAVSNQLILGFPLFQDPSVNQTI